MPSINCSSVSSRSLTRNQRLLDSKWHFTPSTFWSVNLAKWFYLKSWNRIIMIATGFRKLGSRTYGNLAFIPIPKLSVATRLIFGWMGRIWRKEGKLEVFTSSLGLVPLFLPKRTWRWHWMVKGTCVWSLSIYGLDWKIRNMWFQRVMLPENQLIYWRGNSMVRLFHGVMLNGRYDFAITVITKPC